MKESCEHHHQIIDRRSGTSLEANYARPVYAIIIDIALSVAIMFVSASACKRPGE